MDITIHRRHRTWCVAAHPMTTQSRIIFVGTNKECVRLFGDLTFPFTAFDPVAHDYLTTHGFDHVRQGATWEDVGDAENGPKLTGGPAFDEYTDFDLGVTVYIDEDGKTGYETFQPDPYEAVRHYYGRNE